MIYDEDTTEIEIRNNKVVSLPKTAAAKPTWMHKLGTSMAPWIKELDLEAPWIVRLMAVLAIL